MKPQLDAAGVRLVGVGVEELGVEEFVEGKYFKGDLFVDVDKKTYKDLNLKRYGRLSLFPALLLKTSRDAASQSRAAHLTGDLKGDWYQVGGTLVVQKGGEKVLLCHKMEELADHVDNKDVLTSLGIEGIQTNNIEQ